MLRQISIRSGQERMPIRFNLLKEYALVQGITQGGPGLSTTFIIQYIFDKGFNQMQYGYASAISTVVMIIFALIAFAQFKVNNGGET